MSGRDSVCRGVKFRREGNEEAESGNQRDEEEGEFARGKGLRGRTR